MIRDFWQKVRAKLERLANRIDPAAQAALIAAIEDRLGPDLNDIQRVRLERWEEFGSKKARLAEAMSEVPEADWDTFVKETAPRLFGQKSPAKSPDRGFFRLGATLLCPEQI